MRVQSLGIRSAMAAALLSSLLVSIPAPANAQQPLCLWLGQPVYETTDPYYEFCKDTPIPEMGENKPSKPAEEAISLQDLSRTLKANPDNPAIRQLSYIASLSPSGRIEDYEILNRSSHIGGGYYVLPAILPMVVSAQLSDYTLVKAGPNHESAALGEIANGSYLDLLSLKTDGAKAPWAGVCGSNFCGWIGYEVLLMAR